MDGLFIDSEAFGNAFMRLPSELLAYCLCWLPFRDRISVSHVSRFWRSVSLAHPTIWADIDLSEYSSAPYALLGMALSRTGTCPVSLTGSYEDDPDRVVYQCLRGHLHHVRRLVMDLPEDGLPLHTPALLLEELVSTSYHIDIPVDFLGGRPAKLETLDLSTVSLPAVCLVLSTITTLSLDCPSAHEDAVTYGRLFELCPRLIALSLRDLDHAFRDFFPGGPAPLSLRKLFLSTEDEGYDLIVTHVEDWRTESLRDVHLEQESIPLANLARLVAGSTSLRFAEQYKTNTTQLATCDAAGRRHAICFSHDADDAADVADMVLAHAKDALPALQHIELPLAALDVFLPVLAVFPELAQLVLRIPIAHHVRSDCSAHEFPRKMIHGILRVKELCNALRVLVLHLVCPDERCPPTSDEAHGLAKRVLALGKGGRLPRELVIRGSTGDAYDGTVDFDRPKNCVFEFSFQRPFLRSPPNGMTLESGDSKLRAQVAHDFEYLAHEITNADEMNHLADALMTTTTHTLRDLLNEFNARSAVGSLLSAPLAAIFAYLAFPDRIHASHVCRSWRAAALASPALWSRIAPWPPFRRVELLHIALSRTRGLPIDLKITSRTYPDPQAMYAAVPPFSRQLRYLQWFCAQPASPWDFPAPDVEYLHFARTLYITRDFLGGTMGALRYLYVQCVHLPAECHALATVTGLSVVSAEFEDDPTPSSLTNLFDLFPRLEWLQILGISSGASHALPTGTSAKPPEESNDI